MRCMRLVCWFFGHVPRDYNYPESVYCMKCGEWVPYEDLIADTRYYRTKRWLRHWMLRRWWPEKCRWCGHRRRHTKECDQFPF